MAGKHLPGYGAPHPHLQTGSDGTDKAKNVQMSKLSSHIIAEYYLYITNMVAMVKVD